MKRTAIIILKYLSVTAAFFSGFLLIMLALILFGIVPAIADSKIIVKLLIISVIYAFTSPITFSVRYFIRLSPAVRLLIQTLVNYPVLIICAFIFSWISSFNAFCTVTTVYFFAGMAATVFICIYYPYKYRLYNDRLRDYKKKALLEEYTSAQQK